MNAATAAKAVMQTAVNTTPVATAAAERRRDYRDLLIEDLVASEAALSAEVENWARRALEAEQECANYRLLACTAIHHCHDLWTRLRALEGRYHYALDDARRLRAALLERGRGGQSEVA